jgi:hypothetical protein
VYRGGKPRDVGVVIVTHLIADGLEGGAELGGDGGEFAAFKLGGGVEGLGEAVGEFGEGRRDAREEPESVDVLADLPLDRTDREFRHSPSPRSGLRSVTVFMIEN